MDDGSTDTSVEIANAFSKSDSRFLVYTRPESLPKGANSCRNYGATLAKYQHLIFLDADDLLTKDALEIRAAALDEELDLAIFRTGKFTNQPSVHEDFSTQLNVNFGASDYLGQFLAYQIPWHTSSGMWRKDFFIKIGGFDQELQRFQDVEIHIRALASPVLRLMVFPELPITSLYRKSLYHTQVTLEKRRVILDQGFVFLNKIKNQFGQEMLGKTYPFLVYLIFRFEEVFGNSDYQKIMNLYGTFKNDRSVSLSFKMVWWLHTEVLKRPSKIRKLLSFGIFKWGTFID